LVERLWCRLKDWRRIATRYDKLAANYMAGVFLAAAITFWC
ncbi:MAG TPA: IS5/IS1182 family transposase, partial [Hyphomicrobiales bacterium]|nr:IS5/IS1182 family transposase [Hyphomicrobiales bacterium]